MKTAKTVIITILSCYIVTISFLFIKTAIEYNHKMNSLVSFPYDKEYEKAIKEDRKKLKKYKALANEEDMKCLNSIEDTIDYYYNLNHPTHGTTYGEYAKKIFDINNKKYPISYFLPIFNFCYPNINSSNDENKREFIQSLMGSAMYYEEHYNPYDSFGINTNIKIKEGLFAMNSASTIENIKKNAKQTDEFLNNKNQIKAFDAVLRKVGEKYEEK